ncbi:hypothetical protein AB0M50_50215 [Nonomuraea fuscirosea]|uniref:hypothetical protein n=1 Tax=Nonomuraea fuscirosea TaxID=1291556 RepID=UPI00343D5F77
MSVIALTSRDQIQGMAELAIPAVEACSAWRSRLVMGLAAIARFRWQTDQIE